MQISRWLIILLLIACSPKREPLHIKVMPVTATAYNSYGYQTQGNPAITAWGDTLKPGLKVVAISRDLLDSGLTHLSKIYIHELQDSFVVLDKMNRRYSKRIDIYFGRNIDSARQWGRQKVFISWYEERDSLAR